MLFESKTRLRCELLRAGNVTDASWELIHTNICFTFILHNAS